VAGGSGDRNPSGKPRPAGNPPKDVKHDTSPPLRTLKAKPYKARTEHDEHKLPTPKGSTTPDQVVQSGAPTGTAPIAGGNFDGVAVQDSLPPDPNGAAGLLQYVQMVNESFQVFTKTGTSMYGPVPTNTLFTGFGGPCEDNNDGDGTVVYDHLANRWVISQFAVTAGPPYYQCVAVSTGRDATDTWYRYAFQYDSFPDYPKLGTWPDAYYETFNLFDDATSAFLGPEVCAYDRDAMLDGDPATQHCYILDSAYGGLLPSDIDGSTPPPGGAPNYILGLSDVNTLNEWTFHVDWGCSGDGVVDCDEMSDAHEVTVSPFTLPCSNTGGACIPEKSGMKLDTLGDRLMYRLAYRNMGGYGALVVNHSVTAGSVTGIRWYELHADNSNPDANLTVAQQGTYAPSGGLSRWMGSAAMDSAGNIALGYSESSSSTFAGLAYTARLAGDAPGTMTQGETIFKTGSGGQTTYSRWGDYSSMSIDPADDCTFWYTGEYLPNTGAFNWRTRIASFQLPGCAPATVDKFSLGTAPASLTLVQDTSGSVAVNTAVTSGVSQSVALKAKGMPYNTDVTFDQSPINSGDSTSANVSVAADTPPGSYTITLRGTGTKDIESSTFTLIVKQFNAVVNGDFENGLTGWTAGGTLLPTTVVPKVAKAKKGIKPLTPATPAHAAQLGTTNGFGDSTLSQVVTVPTGTTALSFWYQPHCSNKSTDFFKAEIRDAAGTNTLQPLISACNNATAWTKVSFDTSAYAGQDITLWFGTHSGQTRKAANAWIDDVVVGRQSVGVANGNFETVPDFTGWSPGGDYAPSVVTTTPHGGTKSALLGAGGTIQWQDDSSISQTVIVPGVSPTLTVWYFPHCRDSVVFDQIQIKIKSTGGTVLQTLLNTCPSSTTAWKWTKGTYDLSAYAGQSVTIWINVHDDGAPGDETWAQFDDIALTGG
jgi:hypothetical protein